jgi:alpha-ketoglutaric semialdehyde dehydrogenase
MALELARALSEAGLPKGVFNVVVGDGRSVGGELATNPTIAALSFTGSHKVGHGVYQQLAQRMARAQMEMGGKNPTIVLADADLDLAARLVATAGFGLTGQACTATSRVIVEESVAGTFIEKLVAKAKAVVVGNGLKSGVTMGPAVNEQEFQGNFDYIDVAKEEGARLVYGGEKLTSGDLAHGFFMTPAILADVTPEMRIAREEVFGPVVSVISVASFEEAMSVANGVDVGLSASIVTRDLKKAMLYAERIESGVVKINQISTGLALQAPFGGVKKSSTDSFKEQGASAIDFYTRIKTVYLDYSA